MILAAEIINFYLMSKLSFLNFFYLPVLLAGYFMGKRQAIATSFASVFLITLFFLVWPDYMTGKQQVAKALVDLAVWASFLLLAGVLIGTLYEQKEKKVLQLKLAYVGILEILSKYLESYDRHTKSHSVRVSKLAMEIAIGLALPRVIVENVRVAGLLHDIGKVDISIDLIQKSAALTKEERHLIDTHSEMGAELLGLVGDVLDDAIPLVKAHHDYYLNNELGDLPLGARIIMVADCYDAMVSDRLYRRGMLPWQALAEIEKEAGTKFDPKVVTALRDIISQVADDPVDMLDMSRQP